MIMDMFAWIPIDFASRVPPRQPKNRPRDYEKPQNRILPLSNAIVGVQFDEILKILKNCQKSVFGRFGGCLGTLGCRKVGFFLVFDDFETFGFF